MLSPSNNRYMKLDNISSHHETISSKYDFQIHNPIISRGHYDETLLSSYFQHACPIQIDLKI